MHQSCISFVILNEELGGKSTKVTLEVTPLSCSRKSRVAASKLYEHGTYWQIASPIRSGVTSSMRIENETNWRTEQVSKLIYRVAQDELDPGHLKQARVFIKYFRTNGRTAGTCTYGTAQRPRVWMTL